MEYRQAYLFMFVGPLFLVSVLIWLRWFVMAFRLMPLAFHMMLILLYYAGILPVYHLGDVLPGVDSRPAYLASIPGATLMVSSPRLSEVPALMFLRKMLLAEDSLYVMYGPMGMTGLIRLDRRDGSMEEVKMLGLLRDLHYSDGGRQLIGVNWQHGDVLWLDADTLRESCAADIGQYELFTPWNLLLQGRNLFVSNVTYPAVAELRLEESGEGCHLTLVKKLDFFQAGYTKATDGAFGMYLDAERHRFYTLVGMLEARYLIGLVEMDLDTFAILRDVRVPAGVTIFPVPGSDRVLLPSYYYNKLYEISLKEMTLTRTLEAPASIFSLAYDQKRDLLYTVSRTAGVLTVFDYRSGEKIREVPVGAKAEPLVFDAQEDALYVGSKLGILKIDLEEFLGLPLP